MYVCRIAHGYTCVRIRVSTCLRAYGYMYGVYTVKHLLTSAYTCVVGVHMDVCMCVGAHIRTYTFTCLLVSGVYD